MEIRILVIDDEVLIGDLRFDSYERVFGALNAYNPAMKFAVIYAESGPLALGQLRAQKFDFVIVDAVLDEAWMEGVAHSALLELVAKNAPFALVTSRFDESSRIQVSHVMSTGGCQCFISWNEFSKFADHPGALFSLIVASADRSKNLDYTVKVAPDEEVSILHMSDLQWGGYPSKGDHLEIQIIANSILDALGGRPPTFIVLSGDFAEKGLPSEFVGAAAWVRELCKFLGFDDIPKSRVYTVAGNHDACLALAGASRVRLQDSADKKGKELSFSEDVLFPDVLEYAFGPYHRFQTEVSSFSHGFRHREHRDVALNWVDGVFAHLGIVFYGLNSVWPASSEGLPGRSVDEFVVGRVGETLDQIRRQCEANGVPKPFVVGVVHHSPFGDVADRAIVNTDFFAKFLMGAGSTNLLCFGHIHKSGVKAEELEDQKKVICSRASTVTKLSRARDEDTNRGFNLCVLNRKGGSVKDCQVTVFEWMGQRLLSRALSKYEVG